MKALTVSFLLIPSLAFAQMVEHQPMVPSRPPDSRVLNYVGTDDTGRPTCSYIVSSTSTRPRERTSAVVNVDISPAGIPTKAEISDSSGNERLDNASVICAKSWHYTLAARPAQQAVRSVKVEIRWRAPNVRPGPQDDELFMGKPVFEGTEIVDVSL